jgi:hypothetical protein
LALNQNQDYILINENLWKFFIINYGGGPEIPIKNEQNQKNQKSTPEMNKTKQLTEEKKSQLMENSNDKSKIIIKNDYHKYIQETKGEERLETESIRNDECTGK